MLKRLSWAVGLGALALAWSGSADASIFKKIGHAIGGAEKAVGHAGSSVGHAIGKAETSVGHAASSVSRDVGHAVGKTERTVGHTVASAGRDLGLGVKKGAIWTEHAAVNGANAVGTGTKATVKFIDKEAAKPIAAAAIKTTSRVLDETGSVLDSANGVTQAIPVVGSLAGPVLHDSAKIVRSPAAHWGAAAGVGLLVGGGGLAEQTAGVGTTTAGRVALTAGQGAATGYYGRQGDLAVRCYQDPQDAPRPATRKCTRLKAKP